MAVRVADSIKQTNNLKTFPVAYSEDIWIDKNKGSGTPNYDSIQTMYNNDELGNGGSSIQVDTMPIASVDAFGKIYEFIGSTGTYVNGYFYECVSDGEPTPTYSWVQKNVQPNAESFTFNKDDFNIDSSTDKVSLLPSRRVFNGSKADWDLLSVAEKTQYGATAFTDDEGSGMDSPEVITSQVQTGPGYSSGEIVVQKLGHLVQLDLRSVVTTGLEKVIYTGLPKPSNDEPYFVVQGDGNPHILGLGNLRADGILWSGASTAGMAPGVVWDGTIMYFTND